MRQVCVGGPSGLDSLLLLLMVVMAVMLPHGALAAADGGDGCDVATCLLAHLCGLAALAG